MVSTPSRKLYRNVLSAPGLCLREYSSRLLRRMEPRSFSICWWQLGIMTAEKRNWKLRKKTLESKPKNSIKIHTLRNQRSEDGLTDLLQNVTLRPCFIFILLRSKICFKLCYQSWETESVQNLLWSTCWTSGVAANVTNCESTWWQLTHLAKGSILYHYFSQGIIQSFCNNQTVPFTSHPIQELR